MVPANILLVFFLFLEDTCFDGKCLLVVAASVNKCRKEKIPLLIISCIVSDFLEYASRCGIGCLCPILCTEHGDDYCKLCLNGAPETTTTTSTTTSTTTTTSPTTTQNYKLQLIIKDSHNNQPLPGAKIILFLDDQLLGNEVTNSDGTIIFDIPRDGTYSGKSSKEGFIDNNFEFEVYCNNVPDCLFKHLLVMSPDLQQEQTRIMMTWHDKPNDLDLHMMAVKKSDKSTCRTYYGQNCRKTSLDVDNTQGGQNGAETITLEDNTINQEYIYIIGVKDYNFYYDEGQAFVNSQAMVTITNGNKTEQNQMPSNLQKPSELM